MMSSVRRPPRQVILTVGLVAVAFVGGIAVRNATTSTRMPAPQHDRAPAAGSGSATGTSGQAASSSDLATFFGPDFSGRTFCPFKHQNVSIGGSTLTVDYPAGSSAPSAGAPYGGAQLCRGFAGGGATDATLSYDIRFPVGFQFVQGGKLPGMYGGVEPFSGGGHNANGWSMRLMWRTNGAAEVYGYITSSSGYGDSWGRGNFTFQADGQWHHLVERIHLNNPGLADGWVSLSYDGTTDITKSGLAITDTNTPIGGLFFSTFYGGHDRSWAPSALMHIDFANFHASTTGGIGTGIVPLPGVAQPLAATSHHRHHHG